MSPHASLINATTPFPQNNIANEVLLPLL